MIKILKDITTTWAVRLVRPGERFGRYAVKTAYMDVVEFYDTRFEWSPLGAFVAAFDRGFVQERINDDGMILDAQAMGRPAPDGDPANKPEWYISKAGMERVQRWLETQP